MALWVTFSSGYVAICYVLRHVTLTYRCFMFDWLLLLVSPVNTHAEPPKKDLVGVVAAEAAYSALLVNAAPVKPLVDTKDCKRCNGAGRIRSGDGLEWTDCPDCEPKGAPLPDVKIPKSEPNRYKTSDCPNGQCPLYKA